MSNDSDLVTRLLIRVLVLTGVVLILGSTWTVIHHTEYSPQPDIVVVERNAV